MTVVVTPSEFTLVQFQAADIARIGERLRDEIGLPPDLDIEIAIDETTPNGRAVTATLDPLRIEVEGGAFENPKRIRHLSEDNTTDVLGLAFFKARDRLDPSFGAPALDTDLSLAHRVAWDVLAMGRLERLGHRGQRVRRLYHFRNRHGFSDASDAAFDRLWGGGVTTWAELVALSDGTGAAMAAAGRSPRSLRS